MFATLLTTPWTARGLTLLALAQALGSALGGGWSCPLAGIGCACPGCGLTRALVALAKGDLAGAMHLHAFAPVAAVGLLLIALAAVLPAGARSRLASGVARIEARTRAPAVLAALLLLYWLARITLFGPSCGAL